MTPINHHSILSDQHTAALIDDQGSVVWFCPERIDAPPIFGALVGATAGHFSIQPTEPVEPPTQSYGPRDLVLETTWADLAITDVLWPQAGSPTLVRRIAPGGAAKVTFAPRIDFGRTPTNIVDNNGTLVVNGRYWLTCSAPLEWDLTQQGRHTTAIAEVPANPAPVELRFGLVGGSASDANDDPGSDPVRDATDFWHQWCEPLGDASDAVVRHALVLAALHHRATGAFVAAATTSLPECIGGVRNWDYRYCWLRDGAMTASTLTRLGRSVDGRAFLDWTARLLAEPGATAETLRPLYLVDGAALPPETDVDGVSGYAGSLPVRTGNGADSQVQLDVFGPVAELAWRVAAIDGELRDSHLDLLSELAGAVTLRWSEADHGIWEARRSPREYTYTRVMCWLTLKRSIELFEAAGRAVPATWRDCRATIAEVTLAGAWKPHRSTFGTATDGDDLDAAILALGWAGMVDRTSADWSTTIDAVIADLGSGDTIKRYHYDDGLPGDEGGFHLMTSWLIDELVAAGRSAQAQGYFDALVAQQGPTGLLSEEVGVDEPHALGNVPQAYTHLGLIENMLNWPELDR